MKIAIDLDGTLAEYDGWKGIDNIGKPIKGAVEAEWDIYTEIHQE